MATPSMIESVAAIVICLKGEEFGLYEYASLRGMRWERMKELRQ